MQQLVGEPAEQGQQHDPDGVDEELDEDEHATHRREVQQGSTVARMPISDRLWSCIVSRLSSLMA